MSQFEPDLPGTAGVYERWYVHPEQNPIRLQLGDPATTILDWYVSRGLPARDSILDAGCGAGRNLPEIQRLFPQAAITGFDASPTGVASAKAACPQANIVQGNLYQEWPFPGEHYGLVASITSISPEAYTPDQLRWAARSALKALAPGGYWLDESIGPDDDIAQQFPIDPAAPVEEGSGRVVLWKYGNQTKPERVISLPDAITL